MITLSDYDNWDAWERGGARGSVGKVQGKGGRAHLSGCGAGPEDLIGGLLLGGAGLPALLGLSRLPSAGRPAPLDEVGPGAAPRARAEPLPELLGGRTACVRGEQQVSAVRVAPVLVLTLVVAELAAPAGRARAAEAARHRGAGPRPGAAPPADRRALAPAAHAPDAASPADRGPLLEVLPEHKIHGCARMASGPSPERGCCWSANAGVGLGGEGGGGQRTPAARRRRACATRPRAPGGRHATRGVRGHRARGWGARGDGRGGGREEDERGTGPRA
jgi:hypothetical protein